MREGPLIRRGGGWLLQLRGNLGILVGQLPRGSLKLKFLLSRKPVDPEGIYVGRTPQKCVLEITLSLTPLGLDFHMRSGSVWACVCGHAHSCVIV